MRQTFSYSADRRGFLGLVGMLLATVLIEASIVTGLVVWLVPSVAVKLAVAGVMAGLVLFAAAKLLGPLATHHTLDEAYLRLRYGTVLRADIPRSAIASVKPFHQKIGKMQATKARYEATKRRVTACFSERGQLLLQLNTTCRVVRGFGDVWVDSILLNVDRPEEFVSALGPLETAQAPEPAAVKRQALPSLGSPLVRSAVVPGSGVALRTEGLTRQFGDRVAVDQLNLSVVPGEIYGFLGANGAGKTTTIKMLVGLTEPTAGRVWINGQDVWANPAEAKAAMGYVPDRTPLYERLTAREFLQFLAQVRGVPAKDADARLERLLSTLGMGDRADDPSGAYSFGMKRKLGLAAALLHQPSVLILDEPFTGLDPRSARGLKDLLAEVAAAGSAIFLSIHDLATAEVVCHRVGIIHRGRLLVEGESQQLRQMADAPNLEAVFLALTEEQVEETA